MINRSISLTIVFCLLLQIQAVAKITMPVTFGDGMVLQREMPLRLFGEASEGVSVTVRFNGQQQTTASHNGNWMVVPMYFENKTAAEVEMELCPYCRSKAERALKKHRA